MAFARSVFALFLSLATLVTLSGCGMAVYPGQPGVVTNGYSKIDLENLDAEGLWVYEVVYDNSVGGKGVGAIVTKLYPGAQTYTSNVRTNSDGTLYRVKGAYEGADVQMIAVPSLNQVHVSPHSKVQFMLEYTTSLDEIDDKNLAEQNLFKPLVAITQLTERALAMKETLWNLVKAGQFRNGVLSYEVTAMEIQNQTFTPSKPVVVETNLTQNAVRTTLSDETKGELLRFVETNFPKGYKGKVSLQLKGASGSIGISLGLHTLKTAEAAGIKIIRDADERLATEIAQRFVQ